MRRSFGGCCFTDHSLMVGGPSVSRTVYKLAGSRHEEQIAQSARNGSSGKESDEA